MADRQNTTQGACPRVWPAARSTTYADTNPDAQELLFRARISPQEEAKRLKSALVYLVCKTRPMSRRVL